MKKIIGRFIAAAVAIAFTTSIAFQGATAVTSAPFDDISASYAKQEIINLHNKNILQGTSASSFSPDKPITRAEFITVIDRMLGLAPAASKVSPFADVPQSAWYYGWVQAAVQLGLATGTSATTFAPGKEVTRQEAAVWTARAFKQTGKAGSGSSFHDGSRIADWASASVSILHEQGMIQGDPTGNFRPFDSITREETAVLIDRVLQNKSWAAQLEAAPAPKIVIGWQYGQSTEQYKKNILSSNVNTLSPRWYFTEKIGAATDETDKALVAWARENNKRVWPLVGNRSDQETTHQILSNAAARNKLVDQLAGYVASYKLDGLNIDFENVAPKDRESFTAFITSLAAKLHKLGAVLSIDLSPDLGTDWTEAFDYAALGKQADYIVMMAYDEHYDGSPAGSTASLPYAEKAVKTLLKAVPADKIILAMPFYSREWLVNASGKAVSSAYISLTEQDRMIQTYPLAPVWNESLGQYVSRYTKQSANQTIWLEDGRSLILKYKLVVDHRLAGSAYWYIGGESPDIWTSMSNAEKFWAMHP